MRETLVSGAASLKQKCLAKSLRKVEFESRIGFYTHTATKALPDMSVLGDFTPLDFRETCLATKL